jgi:hypothetical protein
MPETRPNYWRPLDCLPRLPKNHNYRSPNNSEYLWDVSPAFKTWVSRKLTVAEAMFLVSHGYDVDVNVHGDPIASKKGAQMYSDAVFVLEQLQGVGRRTKRSKR